MPDWFDLLQKIDSGYVRAEIVRSHLKNVKPQGLDILTKEVAPTDSIQSDNKSPQERSPEESATAQGKPQNNLAKAEESPRETTIQEPQIEKTVIEKSAAPDGAEQGAEQAASKVEAQASTSPNNQSAPDDTLPTRSLIKNAAKW